MSEDVLLLAPDADEATKAAFQATYTKMMVCWGSIMIKTESDGTMSILLPPEFSGFPEEEP